ncbi:hypothetical protein RJ55_01985 [Drechmeria coniospora]|nr:hypothetical protein RJ55_01985 [Drechmeria coniospora]
MCTYRLINLLVEAACQGRQALPRTFRLYLRLRAQSALYSCTWFEQELGASLLPSGSFATPCSPGRVVYVAQSVTRGKRPSENPSNRPPYDELGILLLAAPTASSS